ncbi:hypothetical protein [Gordonia humi]|uniref:Uncharacterized protein n=1 Tax=Gordonia humi TaxID=686429 RepID=A0A840ET57_9ACTN|nr:hypothetical protein [Gordonia humi]MBB4134741.1 hypothetical protein [Gordonia humi]
MANTDPLVAGAKQYLAELSDDEFDTLVAEVREPDSEPKASTVADGRERFQNGRR